MTVGMHVCVYESKKQVHMEQHTFLLSLSPSLNPHLLLHHHLPHTHPHPDLPPSLLLQLLHHPPIPSLRPPIPRLVPFTTAIEGICFAAGEEREASSYPPLKTLHLPLMEGGEGLGEGGRERGREDCVCKSDCV